MANPLWAYFHRGEKMNTTHFRSYCVACVENQRQLKRNDPTYDDANFQARGQCFRDGESSQASRGVHAEALILIFEACENAGYVRGMKNSMIAHILGTAQIPVCKYASEEARVEATNQRVAAA